MPNIASPSSAEFWPAVSKRDGSEATAEQMAAAWKEWTQDGEARDLGSKALIRCLIRAGATEGTAHFPLMRIADGMVLKARKKGFIEWKGGHWNLVEQES